MKINIVQAHNYPGSITRATAMISNCLIEMNHEVIISYPIIQQYSHYKFRLKNDPYFIKTLIFLFKGFIRNRQKKWSGCSYGLRSEVLCNKYRMLPNNVNMPDSDVILTFQQALLPSLIELKSNKGRIIDVWTSCEYEGDIHEEYFDHTFKHYSKIRVTRYALSNRLIEYYKKFNISFDGLFHLGINSKEFFPNHIDEKDNGILFFIASWGAKGGEVAVKIAKLLRKKGVDNKFYSIGDGDGLDLSIFDENYGYVVGSEYSQIYRRHKFFVYTSLFDGFPSPPLEAMSSGAVCLLSNTPGIEEFAENGKEAILCEPGNVDNFVKQIIFILKNDKLAIRLSKNAIKSAQKMSWENSSKQLVDLINRSK